MTEWLTDQFAVQGSTEFSTSNEIGFQSARAPQATGYRIYSVYCRICKTINPNPQYSQAMMGEFFIQCNNCPTNGNIDPSNIQEK